MNNISLENHAMFIHRISNRAEEKNTQWLTTSRVERAVIFSQT
jgi:hypothetical protein